MLPMIITRHTALVAYLIEIGLATSDTQVITHASADDVRGMDVIGVLPMHLAAEARSITIVDLQIPPAERGKELTIEDIREYVRGISTYEVRRSNK